MAGENCTVLAIENFSLGACGRTPSRGVGAWLSMELLISGLCQLRLKISHFCDRKFLTSGVRSYLQTRCWWCLTWCGCG